MKKLIHILREMRMITGKNRIMVPVITKKLCNKSNPSTKNEMTNAATANAIPTG